MSRKEPQDDPEILVGPESCEVVKSFEDMDLKPELLRGIYAYGLEQPSDIQQRAIISIICGRDVVVQAQSGIDKMATLVIPILQKVDYIQALILSPTRELADCVRRTILTFGEYLDFQCHVCLGGINVQEDKAKLQKGTHVVVGTPGSVYNMIKRGELKVDAIKILCLDETDDMSSRGFKDQICDVFNLLPQGTQVVLFSATIPRDVLEITEKLMKDPVRVLVKEEELTLAGMKQFYVAIEKEEWKLETLSDLYETVAITQAVIFCKTNTRADWLTGKMRSWEPSVSVLHDYMEQSERDAVIKGFRIADSRTLITTDFFVGRHVDDRKLSLIINYDFPSTKEGYIKRVGRAGRFGRRGVVFNFVTTEDIGILREIEQSYNTSINEMPLNIADLI